MPRRFLICLAFATWCFLDTWVQYAEGGVAYFARHAPFAAVVAPILCLEVLISVSMFAAWEFLRNRRLTRALPFHYLFLGLCLAPFGIASVAALRVMPFDLTPLIRNRWFWPMATVAAAAPLGFTFLRPRRVSHFAGSFFLYSWPMLLLVLVQSARVTWLKFPASAYADGPSAAAFQSQPPPIRVVWIIFDELSQTIAFGNRPAGLNLPELDRLKAGSFYATSAESPADSTEVSMPSLILGQQVLSVGTPSPNDLEIRTAAGAGPIAWNSLPNVFDAARTRGLNTAVVGWFHPYSRVLNRSLTKSYWTAGWLVQGVEERSAPRTLPLAMWDRVRFQFVALPGVGHLPGMSPWIYARQDKIEQFSWLQDRALELVSDPMMGLILLHLPVPHSPAIYSRATQTFTANGPEGYLDNAALADRTLGTLRQAMEQSGLWDRTAILVSADHGWRTHLWRGGPEWSAEEEAASHQDTMDVPFLLKLPHQTSGVPYSRYFNTIVTRQLLLSILSGQLRTPEALPDLIEQRERDAAAP